MAPPRILLALPALVLACSSPGSYLSDAASGSGDGSAPLDDGGYPTGPCTIGSLACSGTETERRCEDVNGEGRWVNYACEAHNYCIEDHCEAACVDECALGETRNSGADTCRLFSADSQSFVPTDSGSHNLARNHLAWIDSDLLANGYIANTVFSDTTFSTPIAHTGTVDAAEWTGMFLAAESLRLMETRSPDAEANVKATIERAHQLFEVTGAPGYMARIWAPRGQSALLDDLYDPTNGAHYTTTYQGEPAYYHAWTSRDMYSGMLLGLGVAYDAIDSESHKELIREVVVTLAQELATVRTDVPVRIRYNLLGSWQETELTYTMENVVLVPNEMVDGRVFIQVGSNDDPSDYGASELKGAIEFLPNFTEVLGQTPVLGAALPEIPRPGSAIMLTSFIALAKHVTKDVPGREAEHMQFTSYFEANKNTWLDVMKQYAYHNDTECWFQYFGMAIAYHPIYSLLRVLEDGAYKTQVAQQVLAEKMRPFVVGHFNAYFDYIAASQGPAGLVDANALVTTSAQLAGFRPPPKAAIPVDNRGNYPASTECPNQSTIPVDVADRVPLDNLWQHHPFRLVNELVGPTHVYPGTDYLMAYWMGRRYGYVADDGGNTCARWD